MERFHQTLKRWLVGQPNAVAEQEKFRTRIIEDLDDALRELGRS